MDFIYQFLEKWVHAPHPSADYPYAHRLGGRGAYPEAGSHIFTAGPPGSSGFLLP